MANYLQQSREKSSNGKSRFFQDRVLLFVAAGVTASYGALKDCHQQHSRQVGLARFFCRFLCYFGGMFWYDAVASEKHPQWQSIPACLDDKTTAALPLTD
ncbi:hypothetical protein [Paraburkholderia ginsengisoli]|uniref:Uncharacterized protein n=1 Tax=Paraburkholderia ginsengisoli TaxID=311231 RepID=A0A7T4N1K5_9BURK|nr:hypothetical protein [Paraburkholderia ginsengisoli]QQC63582.1 hypothetical protein I6I06_14980 [Paraburkholderia ginsengisoli]